MKAVTSLTQFHSLANLGNALLIVQTKINVKCVNRVSEMCESFVCTCVFCELGFHVTCIVWSKSGIVYRITYLIGRILRVTQCSKF